MTAPVSERHRVAAALIAAHVVAALLVALAIRDAASVAPVVGGVVLAYVWGLQHGFAADHIAAVDDATRLLVAKGRPAAGAAGLAFAAGHGITIVAATLLMVVWSRGQVHPAVEVGALVFVVVFLGAVCIANAALVRRLRRGEDAGTRALISRLGGARLRTRVGRASHLVPVGMVFGVASVGDVVVVVVLGQQGIAGSVLFPVVLVVVFSIGLALVDTLDSVLMAKAYRWASADGDRRRHVNLAATSLTVVVSAFVAVIQLASLLVDTLELPFAALQPAAALAHRFELVGAAVVGLFIVWWVCAWIRWRAGSSWATDAGPAASR
jgi:nickel/cobalt transporter (NiCoT) family protein